MFTTEHRAHWEALAKQNPYFAVLTDEQYVPGEKDPELIARFYASGDEHADRILTILGADAIKSVLDFGCGVGRVTFAFADRFPSVVGVDASPTMLEVARQNSRSSATDRIVWLTLDEFLARPGRYDLVHSFLVLQHIPVHIGIHLLRLLMDCVNQKGHFVIQFPYRREGSLVRRFARFVRGKVPGVNTMVNLLRGRELSSPYMQMNAYDLADVIQLLLKSNFEITRLIRDDDKDCSGVVLVARRNETVPKVDQC